MAPWILFLYLKKKKSYLVFYGSLLVVTWLLSVKHFPVACYNLLFLILGITILARWLSPSSALFQLSLPPPLLLDSGIVLGTRNSTTTTTTTKKVIKTFPCNWHSKIRYYKWLSGALSLPSWRRGRFFAALLLCVLPWFYFLVHETQTQAGHNLA